jgi:AcrR family transcriptional regulator
MPPEGLNPAAYFEAAFELLAERGPDGLTIAALGQRLGLTKGSFYHHFGDVPAFVDALLAHWASEHATRLIARSESLSDATERFELLRGIAISLPHDAEAAIRAWSWSNDTVARVLHDVDQARLTHLTNAGLQAGLPEERARLMATISMSALIGLQQLERPVRAETVESVFTELMHRVVEPTSQSWA